ncbi:MAG: hypothetical protein KIH69_023120 [Anaerolineae bacterium]|nr:hypothetical protein [Anaerolineae bacterium]
MNKQLLSKSKKAAALCVAGAMMLVSAGMMNWQPTVATQNANYVVVLPMIRNSVEVAPNATASPAASVTATATATATPMANATATNAPTATPTATPMPNATATNTPTATPTPTKTPTATSTNTPTATPTLTAQQKNVVCGNEIPQYESKGWRFVMNFEDGTATGCMLSPFKLLGQTTYIKTIVPCQVVGNVTISGGSAKFNGGYIRCDNFDPPGSGAKAPVYFDMHVWAKNVGNQSSSNVNPVFYHPDASMSVPKSTGLGGLTNLFGLNTQHSDHEHKTTPRSISPIRDGWYWFASQRFSTGIAHTLGNVSYPLITPGGLPAFTFDHNPQTIYIGYAPGRPGTLFYGEMDEITVDPQYGGDCC